MFSKNHPIILFVDRSGFSVFQDTLPNIAKFNFTLDVVANFIQINKIVPSSLAVILSDNVIYTKDLSSLQKPAPSQPLGLEVQENIDKEHKEEIQNFLENIPFEEILAKVIKTGEGGRIVAVNRDLVMTIANAFVDKGSIIEAIIPSFLYGPSVNFTLGLTQNNVQAILEGSEIVRVGNLLTDQQKVSSQQSLEEETKEKEKKPQNLRQYILIGVFVTLLIIFVVVYLNLGASQTPPPTKKIKSSPAATVSNPTANSTSVQNVVTVSPIDLRNVKIKIVHNAQIDAAADNLINELTKLGFQDIVKEISQNSPSEKSSIVFSQNIPPATRENIVLEVKKILLDITVLENQDSDSVITILMGKL